MAGLDPAIHVFIPCTKGVDARNPTSPRLRRALDNEAGVALAKTASPGMTQRNLLRQEQKTCAFSSSAPEPLADISAAGCCRPAATLLSWCGRGAPPSSPPP